MSSYELRVPFQLLAHRRLDGLPVTRTLSSGLLANLCGSDGRYKLRVSGFASASEARAFLPAAWAVLAQRLIERSVPFQAPVELTEPTRPEHANTATPSPQLASPVHGCVDADDAFVCLSDEKFLAFHVPALKAVALSEPAARCLEDLDSFSGLVMPRDPQVQSRLRLAVELFSASFAEGTLRSRFIVCVMALEVLASPQEKLPVANKLLDKWQHDLDTHRQQPSLSAEDTAALDSLERELCQRRRESIRSSVRRLVETHLPGDSEAAAKALSAYDVRSSLVHQGTAEHKVVINALVDAEEVLRRTLSAILSSGVGAA